MAPKILPPIYQAIPLSPDDCLFIEAITGLNNAILNIQGTAMNMKGDIVNFSGIINVATPSTLFNKIVSLGYSYLLSVSVATYSLTLPEGDCFVRLSLVNPTTISPYFRRKILDQGYVSSNTGIGYGQGSVAKRTSDAWFVYCIEPANPTAGQNFRYDVPAFVQIQIFAITFILTTSATVADRYPGLETQSVSGKRNNYTTSYNQPASTAFTISYNDTSNIASITGPFVQCAFSPIILGPGSSLRSNIFGIQAADQISSLSIFVRQQTIPSSS